MYNQIRKSLKILLVLFLSLYSLNAHTSEFIVNFSASGVANTFDSIQVLNHTSGTSVTLPYGASLKVYDITSTENVVLPGQTLQASPNPINNKGLLSINLLTGGYCTMNIFNLEGKLMASTSNELPPGQSTYDLTIPTGIYIVKAIFPGGSLNTKVVSTAIVNETKLVLRGSDSIDKPMKVSDNTYTLKYSDGNFIVITAYSGVYKTYMSNLNLSPDKIIDIEFFECKDADGYQYPVVIIGNMVWMAENLRTSKYFNGDQIGTTNPTDKDIKSENMPKYQWAYEGNEEFVPKLGRLYTWHSLQDQRGLISEGWQMPTEDYWREIIYTYANSTSYASEAINLKESNFSRFSAPMAGLRDPEGKFNFKDGLCSFWSSTEASVEGNIKATAYYINT